jgi:hypothetical protein
MTYLKAVISWLLENWGELSSLRRKAFLAWLPRMAIAVIRMKK